jgi:poly-D-alanine transfer protein DltD
MKATKTQLVDYIYNNFSIKGKKLTKKMLNEMSVEKLESIVSANHCEEKLKEWIGRPKMIKFMVDGIQDGKEYSWDCEFSSEEECVQAFKDEGIEVIKIATKSNHHRCKYCGSIADGKMSDLLCDNCREVFGHTFYSEL